MGNAVSGLLGPGGGDQAVGGVDGQENPDLSVREGLIDPLSEAQYVTRLIEAATYLQENPVRSVSSGDTYPEVDLEETDRRIRMLTHDAEKRMKRAMAQGLSVTIRVGKEQYLAEFFSSILKDLKDRDAEFFSSILKDLEDRDAEFFSSILKDLEDRDNVNQIDVWTEIIHRELCDRGQNGIICNSLRGRLYPWSDTIGGSRSGVGMIMKVGDLDQAILIALRFDGNIVTRFVPISIHLIRGIVFQPDRAVMNAQLQDYLAKQKGDVMTDQSANIQYIIEHAVNDGHQIEITVNSDPFHQEIKRNPLLRNFGVPTEGNGYRITCDATTRGGAVVGATRDGGVIFYVGEEDFICARRQGTQRVPPSFSFYAREVTGITVLKAK